MNMMNDSFVSEMQRTRTGAVITAAGKSDGVELISPLTKLGKISIIKRMILMLQSIHVFPIVVVTGYQYVDLEAHLSDYGVIYIRNEEYTENYDKFKSLKMGFEFLKDKCDKVLFSSVMVPMFKSETLKQMMVVKEPIVIPVFEGVKGNPILIDSKVANQLCAFNYGEDAKVRMEELGYKEFLLSVEDEGILPPKESLEHLDALLEEHNAQIWHPYVRLNIEQENVIINERAKMLLLLIEETNSVQAACKQIAMARSKAWEVINNMEKCLGFAVVTRRQGGSKGGKTQLTERGKRFLFTFMEYESLVRKFAHLQFSLMFDDIR